MSEERLPRPALARLTPAERRRRARFDGWLLAASAATLALVAAAAASLLVEFVGAGLPREVRGELSAALAAFVLIGLLAGRVALQAASEWRALWRLEEEPDDEGR